MIKELIDNEEFISLFNIRGRKILRTFVTSNEWDKAAYREQVVLVIEWETYKGVICDSITFEFYDDGRYKAVYASRHNLLGNASRKLAASVTKTVKEATAKYFSAFGYGIGGSFWGY